MSTRGPGGSPERGVAPRAVGIVGTGAVGLALAAELARRGVPTVLVGRQGVGPVEARVDLPVGPSGVGTSVRIVRGGAKLDLPVDVVLVATKAFDLAAALEQVKEFPKGVPVVPLANGAVESIVREAAQKHPDYAWRLGFCDFGVTVVGERHYAIRGAKGAAHFGALSGGPTPAEQWLVTGGRLFCWHDDVARLQRRKWLFNTVINTTAAARRAARNGDLLVDMPMLAAVFSEALLLSEELWGAWHPPRDELFRGMLDLIKDTELNENSMARDVRLGRRTESDFLAGLAARYDAEAKRYPLLIQLHAKIVTSARA